VYLMDNAISRRSLSPIAEDASKANQSITLETRSKANQIILSENRSVMHEEQPTALTTTTLENEYKRETLDKFLRINFELAKPHNTTKILHSKRNDRGDGYHSNSYHSLPLLPTSELKKSSFQTPPPNELSMNPALFPHCCIYV